MQHVKGPDRQCIINCPKCVAIADVQRQFSTACCPFHMADYIVDLKSEIESLSDKLLNVESELVQSTNMIEEMRQAGLIIQAQLTDKERECELLTQELTTIKDSSK